MASAVTKPVDVGVKTGSAVPYTFVPLPAVTVAGFIVMLKVAEAELPS